MRKIESSELKQMLDRHEDMVLINVLDAESFASGHIPGSHNIPYDDPNLVREAEQLAGRKNRRVVVYCQNPKCTASPDAGKQLERAGFSDVLHYAGGIDGWKDADYDVESGAPAPVM